jgi:ribonuclease HII
MLECYKHTRQDAVVVGVDEAGRGCLFGPVFAAAVVWDACFDHPLVSAIKDSKKLSKSKRKELRTFIEKHAIAYGVGSVDANEIDQINILNATYKAMHNALDAVKVPFDHIIVDGNRFKPYMSAGNDAHFIPHTVITGGDNAYLQIAAASILAKTYHDEYIETLLRENPHLAVYNLDKHMGYGTAAHFQALAKHGPSTYHRMSFKGVKQS